LKKIVFLLVSILFLSGFTTPNKALEQSTWGTPRNGLQAMLYSPKQEYSINEKIELRVKVRNATNEPMIIKPQSYKNIYINVNGKAEEKILSDENYTSDNINLAPGETKDFLIFYYGTKEGTGVYDFSGALGDLQLPQIQIRVK
jgi:hypothetical protein